MLKWNEEIEKVSKKKHNEYVKFFETIRDLLIENLIEKKTDLKERLELISKYSNNSLVRNLSFPEKLFLYETKRVFDLHYFNTKPAHALFLDTKFKIKYVCDKILSPQERILDVDKIVDIIKEKVANSDILKEYKKEYKKIYGRHYKYPKEFTEKKFKQWSKKAIKLSDSFNDSQIEEFKIELQKLSGQYYK